MSLHGATDVLSSAAARACATAERDAGLAAVVVKLLNSAHCGLLAKRLWLPDSLCTAIRLQHAEIVQLRATGSAEDSRLHIAAVLLAKNALQACYGQGSLREREKDGEQALVKLGLAEGKIPNQMTPPIQRLHSDNLDTGARLLSSDQP